MRELRDARVPVAVRAADSANAARRDVKGLGTALMVMLGFSAASFLAMAAAQLRRHSLVTSILDAVNGNGEGPALSTVQTSDNLVRRRQRRCRNTSR
jgi:hypothetical protein